MLKRADAALLIGDTALFVDAAAHGVEKFDLGAIWTRTTGLPFVYAFWAGWPDAIAPGDVASLQQTRDRGIEHVGEIARTFCPDDRARQELVGRYLRDNIQYVLGGAEKAGLTAFYRYASELNLVPPFDGALRIFHAND
jgi:predicted solute-binding protein